MARKATVTKEKEKTENNGKKLRAVAIATIQFGLVSVPIKLYSPRNDRQHHFSSLCPTCHEKLYSPLVCSEHGEIPRDEVVSGYKVDDGYMVMSKEEIVKPESTGSLVVSEFVPLGSIPHLYFSSSYYIGPNKGGEKAYSLFAAALSESGMAAIAEIVIRNSKRVIAITALTAASLVAYELYFTDDLRSFDLVGVPSLPESNHMEVSLAIQLIGSMSNNQWNPGRYHDEYWDQQQKIIDNRKKNKKPSVSKREIKKNSDEELLDAMMATIENNSKGRARKNKPKRIIPSGR